MTTDATDRIAQVRCGAVMRKSSPKQDVAAGFLGAKWRIGLTSHQQFFPGEVTVLKGILKAGAIAAAMMWPASYAQADLHALLGIAGGAIITCGVTGACGNGNGGNRTTTTSTRTCGPQCQGNIEAQRALAFFGYNPGGADGVWGQNSRRAASAYEAEMGFFPVDGQLNDAERAFLVSSYQRAESGFYGAHQPAYVQGGPRALLISFNDERLGRFNPAPTTTVVAPQAPAPTTTIVAPPATTTVVQTAPAAQPFTGFTLAATGPSMADYCTAAMSGQVDPNATLAATAMDQTLGQQFCLAMDYVTTDGAELRTSVAGMTPDQVAAQCEGLASMLAPQMAALTTQPRPQAEGAIRGAMNAMTPDQAVTAGRICSSVGYETDNAGMALAGVLTLAAFAGPSYGELVGHHLRQGFGTAPDRARSQEWHMSTIAAMDAGAAASILPEQANARNAIIRAAFSPTGQVPSSVVNDAADAATTLPTFTITGN